MSKDLLEKDNNKFIGKYNNKTSVLGIQV